jgi:predicted dehydrogenase
MGRQVVEHNVAIVGCGLIGQKRAKALGRAKLVACADIIGERAQTLAKNHGAFATTNWRDVVQRADVSLVMVATTNHLLAEVTIAALEAGKHVLVEKPGALCVAEIDRVIAAQRKSGCLVRVGFNHRYHPALLQAKALMDAGELGEMMFVRGRYGHGGRIGYDREWRADPRLSGGGELIDQGVHLIDLARLFVGDIARTRGYASTYFWDMPVDDNAFMLLTATSGQTAHLHVSCTEWKNLFCFEIYGKTAKLQVDGLGGSYGLERLAFYKMLKEMGPPETTIWEYPRGDRSWEIELVEFLDDIERGRQPSAGLADARAALEVVQTIYAERAQ